MIGGVIIKYILKKLLIAHNKKFVTLQEIYQYEFIFELLYANNKSIRDSIRRLLQELRDEGFLIFLKPGHYEIIQLEGNDEI